jgi:N,N'-diacetyllegionaminate synthase
MENEKVIIIAEAGVNHNGNFEMAQALIDAASDAGADYVKFQTFKADKITSKSAKKASYQTQNIKDGDDSQYNMLKKLELRDEWHHQLKDYADSKNIKFLSTGFDEDSIDFLDNLGIDFFKIPSGEITNKPYLIHIARKKKPIIISTGMADMTEIQDAVSVLEKEGIDRKNIIILHCNTEYPTPMRDVNLLAMNEIGKKLNVVIGYSDHTLGIEVPIAAVALGARVIEKHFTLDRSLPGPDHVASLEPSELKQMVDSIRNIELAIAGNGLKEPSASETPNKAIARKSIHINVDIAKGSTIMAEMLAMRRPGDGISPMLMDEVIGKKTNQDLAAETKLQWEHLEK